MSKCTKCSYTKHVRSKTMFSLPSCNLKASPEWVFFSFSCFVSVKDEHRSTASQRKLNWQISQSSISLSSNSHFHLLQSDTKHSIFSCLQKCTALIPGHVWGYNSRTNEFQSNIRYSVPIFLSTQWKKRGQFSIPYHFLKLILPLLNYAIGQVPWLTTYPNVLYYLWYLLLQLWDCVKGGLS